MPSGDKLFFPRAGTRTFPVEGTACRNPACWSRWGLGWTAAFVPSLMAVLGGELCVRSWRLGVPSAGCVQRGSGGEEQGALGGALRAL